MARAGLRLWSGSRGRSSARSKNDVLPQLVVGLQVPVGVAEFVGEPPRAQLSKPGLQPVKDLVEVATLINDETMAIEHPKVEGLDGRGLLRSQQDHGGPVGELFRDF